jgi:hypothetical protein
VRQSIHTLVGHASAGMLAVFAPNAAAASCATESLDIIQARKEGKSDARPPPTAITRRLEATASGKARLPAVLHQPNFPAQIPWPRLNVEFWKSLAP